MIKSLREKYRRDFSCLIEVIAAVLFSCLRFYDGRKQEHRGGKSFFFRLIVFYRDTDIYDPFLFGVFVPVVLIDFVMMSVRALAAVFCQQIEHRMPGIGKFFHADFKPSYGIQSSA